MKRMLALLAALVVALLAVPPLTAGPVPGTRLTQCYDATALIACPSPGEPFYGQDGNFILNPPSYVKLDASGRALPDSAVSWAMVRDNTTGLVWEHKTFNDGSIHEARTFTWCKRSGAGDQGTCGTGTGLAATDTDAFIRALNDTRFGGFSDWRLPTVHELMTIVDGRRTGPAIDAFWFPNLGSEQGQGSYSYWSSTVNATSQDMVWNVIFNNGDIDPYPTQSWNAARAVRGGVTAHRYSGNGDGTVTDAATGLMWQQGTTGAQNWELALKGAEDSERAGYTDWRLPNLNELLSLADYRRADPAVDPSAFPETASSNCWSSTPYAGTTGEPDRHENAWYIDFRDGVVRHANKLSLFSLRAVRGGQIHQAGHPVITSPLQGDRWGIGRKRTLTWETAGIAGNVRILLSRQGGKAGTFTEVVAEAVSNSGSYAWTVSGPESVNCALRIEPAGAPDLGTAQGLFTIAAAVPGDVNDDRAVDLADALLAMQAMGRLTPPGAPLNSDADVNGDGRLGIPEAVFVLQSVAGLRGR